MSDLETDIPAEQRRGAPPVGQYVDSGVDGVMIHLHDLGPKDGNVIVFVHGSGPGASGWSNFKQNIDAFTGAGYRVIVPDLVGYGYSTKPTDIDYTRDLFCDTLKGAIEALGIFKVTMVGNSLGGALSLRIALDHPDFVERLILMAPGGIEELDIYFAMPGIAAMMSGFAEGLTREAMGGLLTQLVHDPKHVTQALTDERFAIVQDMPPEVLGRMRIPNQVDELPKLKQPILGFWGIQDRFCPHSGAEKVMQACPQARFLMVADCGHWVMVEHADLFNRTCRDFLEHG